MDLRSLEIAIETNDVQSIEKLLNELSKHQHKELVPLLVKYLGITENPSIRNTIAMMLRDIGDEEAVQPLVDLLKDPKTIGSRGTLLYALEPFDCIDHLEVIVEQFLAGNFEEQAQAFQLIASLDGKATGNSLVKSLLAVKEQLNEIDRQRELHLEVLEFLFDLKVE